MLLWVANAPIYGLDSNNAIENFVYKCISCDNNTDFPTAPMKNPIFMKLKEIIIKRLVGRKIKPFVN
jgi:hypothetical protein